MDDGILNSIKTSVSVDVDNTAFDDEILMAINTSFFTINQLGIGPEKPFKVTGTTEQWTDFLPDIDTLEILKTYIQLKVRILFDPPTSSQLATAMNDQIQEYEWRMLVERDRSFSEYQEAVNNV